MRGIIQFGRGKPISDGQTISFGMLLSRRAYKQIVTTLYFRTTRKQRIVSFRYPVVDVKGVACQLQVQDDGRPAVERQLPSAQLWSSAKDGKKY
jgi:hypothetical protein